MNNIHELIKVNEGLPIKLFVHSLDKIEMHLHKEIEILLVLKGSINVVVGGEKYLLSENDLILLNKDEIHSISRNVEDNICLALQVDSGNLNKVFPNFTKMVFDCKSFKYGPEEQERFDKIRYFLAKLIWEISKKKDKYQYSIGSYLDLINSFI